ncbi:hypothetical protein, partial [Psychrobacter celer]|uniref:hypothetical protein n=1 Tax=Psychrobacter celer TaxID=306572 RepID=UPI003FD5583B
ENKVIGKDVLINPPGASAGGGREPYPENAGYMATYGEPDRGGGGLDDLTKPIYNDTVDKKNAEEAKRRADHRAAIAKMGGLGRNNVDIVDYKPEVNYDKEKYASLAGVYGENSETGQFSVDALKKNNDLNDYNAQQAQIERNRANNIAAQAARARSNTTQNNATPQRPLDIKSGQPPSLYDDVGYENPMANVRDGWKEEAVDGLKQSTDNFRGAVGDINPIVSTGNNIYDDVASGEYREAVNKGAGAVVDKVQETVIESAQEYGASKSKVIDKANDVYEDYNKAQDIQSQAEEAVEWKRKQGE